MKRPSFLLASALLMGFALAAQGDRVIKFNKDVPFQGNLRTGPYNFNGSADKPVKATVSTLTITAPRATLAAPSGVAITDAEGKRTAEFSGDVTVTRGRLTARGPSLLYTEESGNGALRGGARATYRPEAKDGDTVNIAADTMTFDVDTEISTSRGGVKFTNGNQTGASESMVFDENRELGLLTGSVQMNRAASGKEKALAITGTEARVLTEKKLLYVKGKIRLVSGDIVTTGDAMYYDDEKNRAVVVGNPALSVNSKAGTRVSGGTLEQRTDLGRVQQLRGEFKMPTEQFKLSTEK